MPRIIYDASFLQRFTPEQDGIESDQAELATILCEEQSLGIRVIWAEPSQYGHEHGAVVYQICDATSTAPVVAFDDFSNVIDWLED